MTLADPTDRQPDNRPTSRFARRTERWSRRLAGLGRPAGLPLMAALWVIAPLMAIVPVRAADAQFGQVAQFSDVMRPYFMARDVRFFADELQLDDDQNAILQELFYDYQDGNDAGQSRLRDRFEGMKDEIADIDQNDKEAVAALVMAPFIEQAEAQIEQKDAFLDTVKAILNEEQRQLWPAFERALRREKELPRGLFAGESVDLFTVVRQSDLDPVTAGTLQDTLDQYELDLDTVLAARERLDTENRPKLMGMLGTPGESSVQLVRDRVEASKLVRDVNLQFAETLASRLSGADSARFRQVYRELAFPSIVRPTAAQRILDRAVDIETLDESDVAAVTGLIASYRAEVGPIVEGMIRAQIAFDPIDEMQKANQFVGRETNDARAEALRRDLSLARTERSDMDKRYMVSLQEILTRSEFMSLPGATRFIDRTGEGLGTDAGQAPKDGGRANRIREAGTNSPVSGAPGRRGGRR
ncbi:MAG: hypothetical protein AB8G96_12525 [Phycisphaerales bacterium]